MINFSRKTLRIDIRSLFLGTAMIGGLLPLQTLATEAVLDGQQQVQGNIDYVNNHGSNSDNAARGAGSNARGTGPASNNFVLFKSLEGQVQGGAAPLGWSAVTVYAAGASGPGSAAVIGLGYSDGTGDIHAIYVCPLGNPQIYVTAFGGNAGRGYNSSIGLSAALGACNGTPAALVINEVTTVASVTALNQFLDSSATKPGSSASNKAGLGNAALTVANLADLNSGLASSSLVSGASGTAPTATVNTLADVLAPCVTAASASAAACTSLFSAATTATGVPPSNTLQAALNIARNPGRNVGALYALAAPAAPYLPKLSTAPREWTLAISFSGAQLANAAPTGLAIDAAGNAWVSNNVSDSSVNLGNGSVVRLSPQGVQAGPYVDNGAINFPFGIAIDAGGRVFVANNFSDVAVNGGAGSISGLSSAGTSINGSPFASGGLQNPTQLAVDAAGNVVASNQTSVTRLSASAAYAGINYPVVAGNTFAPNLTALALDAASNIFVGDANNNLLIGLSAANPSQQLAGSPYSGDLSQTPAIAFDGSGNVWAANTQLQAGPAGVVKFVKTSTGFSPVTFLGNDVSAPGPVRGLSLDGLGSPWIANANFNVTPTLNGAVALNADGSLVAGSPFAAGRVVTRPPQASAIDASGNVWLSGGFGGNVVQIVGVAKPVKTPLIGLPVAP